MLRFVFLASFGAITFQSAHADEPPVSAISPVTAPASSIARSPFAIAKRDEARLNPTISAGKLQATSPEAAKDVTPTPVSDRAANVGKAKPASAPSPMPLSVSKSEKASPSQAEGSVNSFAKPAHSSHGAPLSTTATTKPTTLGRNLPQSFGPRFAALPHPTSDFHNPVPPLTSQRVMPSVGPKVLSSRDMNRLRSVDDALGLEEGNLSHAGARLTRYQQQLGVFTSVLSQAMSRNGDDGAGLNPFVRVARRYRGTPYVWGGESARGFDCSGFIMRVMRDLGYRALPHSAAEQFNYGMPVAREALKPGDIVFFANTYKRGVSHVGIYLGGRQFIHAANSRVGTIVSSIDEPKWIEHYAGARRLLISRS